MYDNHDSHLIDIGHIELQKENVKGESYCHQDESYDYHGLMNPMCKAKYFIPKRIVVIQMN